MRQHDGGTTTLFSCPCPLPPFKTPSPIDAKPLLSPPTLKGNVCARAYTHTRARARAGACANGTWMVLGGLERTGDKSWE